MKRMRNKHYYLVASLPYLIFEDEPPVSSASFLEECRKWLSDEEMRTVKSADISGGGESAGGGTVLSEWLSFDRRLRKSLALFRKARKSGEQFRAENALKSITEQENPLLMEKEFERLRWRFLEEKAAGFFYDINSLVIYYLQLQILQRLASFDRDKGERYFYELCEVDYEQAIG
ncbi:MAG: DUF2764 family protein [Candidatus Omnitrophica bacterium]|nr:DUF2764 family protein [Candidatus Omnitrophota bacterium]